MLGMPPPVSSSLPWAPASKHPSAPCLHPALRNGPLYRDGGADSIKHQVLM